MTLTTAPANDPMVTHPRSVVAVREETHDTVTIDLEMGDAPGFAPGQFNMLYAFGIGESAISISSDPATPAVCSHTIRRVGWVTRALTGLQPGDTVGVRGPFGTSWPLAAAEGGDLVVVAGGIGLAPVRPVILQALAHRDRFRRVVLLVGARAPGDLLFVDDLRAWDADPRITVDVTVDRAERGWTGPVGVVTSRIGRVTFDPDQTTAMTCGPEVMMRFTARELVGRGVAPDRVHVSLERTMRCGVGTCGHCQLGPLLVCRDGAVVPLPVAAPLMQVGQL